MRRIVAIFSQNVTKMSLVFVFLLALCFLTATGCAWSSPQKSQSFSFPSWSGRDRTNAPQKERGTPNSMDDILSGTRPTWR